MKIAELGIRHEGDKDRKNRCLMCMFCYIEFKCIYVSPVADRFLRNDPRDKTLFWKSSGLSECFGLKTIATFTPDCKRRFKCILGNDTT